MVAAAHAHRFLMQCCMCFRAVEILHLGSSLVGNVHATEHLKQCAINKQEA